MNVIVNQPVRRLPHTEHTRLSDGLGLVASDTNGLSISQDFLQKSRSTGCSLNIVMFFLKIFVIFLNSTSSVTALVFYLPGGVCTHTDIKVKQIKTRVRNIRKSLEKNTIFNE